MRPLLLLAAALALAAPAWGADPAGGDPMRDSLRRVGAPWYDAKADDWRRVELPKGVERKEDEPDRAGGTGIFGTIFTVLMYGLVAVAVGALLWFVGRTWQPWSAADAEAAAPTPTVNLSALPFQLAVRQHGDPDSALAAALAAGDWALAAMWIYAIQLLRLDRTGLIRLVPGKTNRTYVREIQNAERPVRDALAGSVAVFERSFFGHQVVDEGEVRDLQRRHAAFLAALAAAEGRS